MDFSIKDDIVNIKNIDLRGISISDFEKELSLIINYKFNILGITKNSITIRFFKKNILNDEFAQSLRNNIIKILNRNNKDNSSTYKKFIIIPTGDEILEGIVEDQNSPIIAGMIIRKLPGSSIIRSKPSPDNSEGFLEILNQNLSKNPDYIIITGGTGGGRNFSESLSKDIVHDVLKNNFENILSRNIYGRNGHLFSTLNIVLEKNTTILSLPGPKDECTALFEVFLKNINEDERVIIDKLRGRLIEIHETKYDQLADKELSEEEIIKQIIKFRSMGIGARQIAKQLNKSGSNLKFYQVQYRLNKLENKI